MFLGVTFIYIVVLVVDEVHRRLTAGAGRVTWVILAEFLLLQK